MGKAPNNANIFDLEDKIRFEEFAPSLQRRLETIRTDIEQAWGNGAFSKKFRKYGKLSSDKTKIDQIYDSDSINADRDSNDDWNITGLWKAVETIWGGGFFTPPKGTASKGIKPIWDKLNNHEGRISTLETHDTDHEKRISDLESNPSSSGYNPSSTDLTGGSSGGGGGGGSYGITWGNSGGFAKIGTIIIQFGTTLYTENRSNKPAHEISTGINYGGHINFSTPFTREGYAIVGSDVGQDCNMAWAIGFCHKSLVGCDWVSRAKDYMNGTVLLSWIAVGQ